MVTNASLKMKRMPEDIPVLERQKESTSSRFNELMEEGIDHLHDLKKKVEKVKGGLHQKMHRRRKSVEPEENELQTIKVRRGFGWKFWGKIGGGKREKKCQKPFENAHKNT